MNGDKNTILIVDDVPDDIVILDEILKKEYQVKAVTNGEAALKIARGENPPDLILLDIIMPGMDGFEVCRRLKQDVDGAMIPVIFLTAKVMSSDEKLGFELGAVDYIKKPIEPEVVLSRIKAHLDQKDRVVRFSEVRFRRLFETSMDAIMVADCATGTIMDVNPAMATLMGVSQEYFLGKNIAEPPFLAKVLAMGNGHPDLPVRGYIHDVDEPVETVDGRRIYVEFTRNTYTVDKRELMQLNIRDITEKKRSLERLEALLQEKGVLLREIHHRVNNNVQIMIGLLGISLEQVNDAGLRGKLDDIMHRMQSMATIHQQFYESQDMSRIDFAVYVKRLLDRLRMEFPESSECVVVECETGVVLLNLEEAIPAGLIVNELLTNALKYAFPGDHPKGIIKLTQRIHADTVEIEVRDDGVGLPDGFDPKHAKSLGMELIRILSLQLGGSVDFKSRGGTDAILRFVG